MVVHSFQLFFPSSSIVLLQSHLLPRSADRRVRCVRSHRDDDRL